MKYTRFLDEGISGTPLNVTDDVMCFVSITGDMKTCPTIGGPGVLVPTEAQRIESFAIHEGTAYFTADGGTRVGWVKLGEKVPTTLWYAEWDPVVIPENVSASDVSTADAA